jgi:O-antigen/teichoic acid export membrane protein
MSSADTVAAGGPLSRVFKGRTFKNFSWLLAERMVSLSVAIFVSIPVARYLGPHDFGGFSYVLAMSQLVAPLASLGLEHIVTKELVQYPGDAGRILGTVATLRKTGAFVAFVIVSIWMFVAPPGDPKLSLFVCLIVGSGLVGSLTFLQYWFLSNGTMNAYSIAQISNTLIFSGIRLSQVYIGAHLDSFIIVASIEVLSQGFLTFIAYRLVRKQSVKWSFDWQLAKKLFGRSWPLTLSGMTAAVYLKLDLIMLASMGTAAEAGVYAAAARLSEIWYFVPALLMTAMFPTILKLKEGAPERYQKRLQDIMDCLAALGMSIAVVVSFGSPFIIHILYGPKFAAAAPMLSIHVWSGVFIFMRALLSKWMITEDLYIFSLVTHGIGAIANVLLNIVLIPKFGGMGASVATLISYATVSYFSLLVHRKTWPMFLMMSKALFWPRRLPEVVAFAAARVKARQARSKEVRT